MDFIDNHFDCYFNGTKFLFFLLPICLYFLFVYTWWDEIVLLCKQIDHKFLKWKFLKENYYDHFPKAISWTASTSDEGRRKYIYLYRMPTNHTIVCLNHWDFYVCIFFFTNGHTILAATPMKLQIWFWTSDIQLQKITYNKYEVWTD